MTLTTERLVLRPWRESDREPFAAMNADPVVMKYFPSLHTRAESDVLFDRGWQSIQERGWGPWAVEIPGVLPFAGFIGLTTPRFEAAFTPCVEVGWRLASSVHNRGYATEGARAALRYGFETLGLHDIVSFTTTSNAPSRRVMEKLGFTHHADEDFDHPKLAPDSPLRRHALYRLTRAQWERQSRK